MIAYKQPDADFRDALNGSITYPDGSSGTLTKGTNLFSGPMRATSEGSVADAAVACTTSGGPAPVPYAGGVGGGLYAVRIQAMIRSAAEDYDGGIKLALAVRNKMHASTPSGYVSCLAVESAPQYLSQDDNRHHRWVLNFELRYTE